MAAVLTALALSAGPTIGGEPRDAPGFDLDLVPALRADVRRPVFSTELRVNLATDERLIVPNKCEEDGERELLRMADGGGVEEAFAFVPALCLWIDVGFDQTATTIRIDRAMVDALVRANRRIVLYHTHPGAPDRVIGYLPAYLDLVGVILVNTRYRDAPDADVRHRAMTAVGVLEYGFRPSAEARSILAAIVRSGLGDFAGENLSLVYLTAAREAEYYVAARACEEKSGGRLDGFASCFPMTAGDFVLDYRGMPREGPTGSAAIEVGVPHPSID